MGVSNVNNTNMIAAVKAKLGKKPQATAQTPEYLQMSGSVFSAPLSSVNFVSGRNQTTRTTSTNNVMGRNGSIFNANHMTSLNTRRSITDLGNNSEGLDLNNITDISSGKAAITEGNNLKSAVTSKTNIVENAGKKSDKLSSSILNLTSSMDDKNKTFLASIKTHEQTLKKNNQEIEKILKENEEKQREVDDMQRELDRLTISNGSQDKINDLRVRIGSKISGMQRNGKIIYSLQRTQSRTLSRMNRLSNRHIAINKQNTKNIQQQQTQNNKTIETATEIEAYSALASQSGQLIDYAGQGLVALGTAMSGTLFGSALGSALITVGTVMSKVGTVVNTLGQYGQLAANVTKTIAYATDGNIMGAMQSAAAATQSGMAAAKSTSNLKSEFGKINDRANEAAQNVAAKTAARQTVKNMSTDELGGMTKKEMKKAVKSNLLEQMKDSNNNISLKELRKGQNLNAVNNAVEKSKADFKTAVEKAKGSIENNKVIGLDSKTRKAIGKNAKNSFSNEPIQGKKVVPKKANKTNVSNAASTAFDGVSRFGNGFNTNMFGTNPYNLNNNNTMKSQSKTKVKGMSSAYRKIKARRA